MTADSYKRRMHIVVYLLGLIALLAVGVYILQKIHLVASIMAVSILLAYLIAPAVNALVRRGLSRIGAITVVYILLAALVGFFVAYLVPVASREFEKLIGNIGGMANNLESILGNLIARARDWAPEALKPQLDPARFELDDLAVELQKEAPALLGGTLSGVMFGVKSAAGILAGAVLVPLITFYILMDAEIYRRGFMSLVPHAYRPNADDLLHRIDFMLGRYIRGQIIVCVTIGFNISVALSLLGVEYAILIGIFAGVVDIIPYVGVLIGLIPAFFIALINHGLWWAILTLIVLECIHWLEGHIIVPAVIGHSVGLPPLTVMVALMMGAEIGGIMGMFVAIPLAAIVRVFVEYYVEKNGDPALVPGDVTPEADTVVHAEPVESVPLDSEPR